LLLLSELLPLLKMIPLLSGLLDPLTTTERTLNSKEISVITLLLKLMPDHHLDPMFKRTMKRLKLLRDHITVKEEEVKRILIKNKENLILITEDIEDIDWVKTRKNKLQLPKTQRIQTLNNKMPLLRLSIHIIETMAQEAQEVKEILIKNQENLNTEEVDWVKIKKNKLQLPKTQRIQMLNNKMPKDLSLTSKMMMRLITPASSSSQLSTRSLEMVDTRESPPQDSLLMRMISS